ncbi:LacI family DNA-binding transcriptional regulator [Sediminispirochaeta bajacaliforniensis]|uniref:LacI family DNA-binding transcriptional regulator n=1 Tax=Sediminispirochaeta bajacaliforniensis TaxID=148 RepID=UPI001B7F86D2|nr:LacI family DNA-binding transcriptional regulator [Sediminispirochaeta bajacaliforniensis]
MAKLAKVSPSTVSRVIHNSPRISDQTKNRVREAMKSLGYHPNAAARSLVRGETKTIGLIIPNSENDLFFRPFFIMAMRGISIEAQKQGYNIMYAFSTSQPEEVEFLQRFVQRSLVDGIILMAARQHDSCMEYLESREVPYAVIGHPGHEYPNAMWVDNDNFKAMYDVTATLFGLGLRRIAFLGGVPEMSVTRDRLRGYKEAFTTHEIDIDQELIHTSSGFQEEDGYQGAKELLKKAAPEAFAAADDLLALGALQYMEEENIRLPIIGFNNTIKGSIQHPTLSSVDILPDQLGIQAAELLIKRLKNEPLSTNFRIVDTCLIERETTLFFR